MYSLNPNFRISNTILAYYGCNGSNYQNIRRILKNALLNTSISFSFDFNLYVKKEGLLRFNIIYISPMVEALSDVRLVILGEVHHEKDIQAANAKLIDQFVEPRSTFFAEELISSPLAVQSEKLRTLVFNMLSVSRGARQNLALHGWDYMDLPLYAAAKMIENGAPKAAIDSKLDEEDRVKAIREHPVLGAEYNATRMEKGTPSFINTIRHWGITCSEKSGRAFAITGLGHLVTPLEKSHDARWSLADFYKLLTHLPVMVLFPRV